MSDDNNLDTSVDGDDGEFSLASLAGFDTSDIAEVRFENLPAMTAIFTGVDAKLEKTKNAQDETRFKLTLSSEVSEVKAVIDRDYKSDEKKAELIGKKHKESFWIVPSKAEEGIGLIRAFFADIGLPNAGPIGAAEDDDGNPIEGFADGFIGHSYTANIVRVPRKDDPSTKDSRLRLPPKK